jgi:hypothetical protein
MEEMDWMNKAEGWDWIGLEEKDRKNKMKESGWKKWTGSRTGKNLTGRKGPEEEQGRN